MMESDAHLDYLDALRGYAIIGVMAAHFCRDFTIGLSPFLNVFGSGVTLFYALSAFCLMLSLGRRMDSDWKGYFVRRFFRIAPAFYVAIAVWVVYYQANGIKVDLCSLVTSMLFINGFWPAYIHSVIPHGWSIAVETTFYLVLPFLFNSIRSFRTGVCWLAILLPICFFLSWAAPKLLIPIFPSFDSTRFSEYTVYWFPAHLPVFLFGVVTYLFLKGGAPLFAEALSSNLSRNGAFLLLLGVASVASAYLPVRVSLYIIAASFCGVIACLSINAKSILVNRWAVGLGQISFSAYLYHQLALDYYKKMFPAPATIWQIAMAASCVLLLTVVLASASYFLVERPGGMLGSKASKRLGASSSAKRSR